MSGVTVRTLQADDAERLLRFELDNRAWFERHIDPRGEAFYTADGVRDHIAHYLDAHARRLWHPCVMLDQFGAIVGRANLKDIDVRARVAEVGYRMAQRQTGTGLATQAVRHLIDLARARWALERLVGHVSVDNAASARVLEKCGFVRSEPRINVASPPDAHLDGYHYALDLRDAAPLAGPASGATDMAPAHR
jgi:ribosomal-protein-alanine N-acetyltransferase